MPGLKIGEDFIEAVMMFGNVSVPIPPNFADNFIFIHGCRPPEEVPSAYRSPGMDIPSAAQMDRMIGLFPALCNRSLPPRL
uniref:Uncharacterized protein n=1 Tax=Candidatus Kentrum sp. DK TaxID=2126562 RepID=A0A450TS48_9GAMM|nr:MAG: hypothetical protein BECKDK2373B_GA0170837_13181 [Candidatus Kentron sp. DK]